MSLDGKERLRYLPERGITMIDWKLSVSIVFGALNVIQWIQGYIASRESGSRKQQLETIKASLIQLNAMCNDAEGKGDAKKPDAMARFISDVAHMGRTIEHPVDIMLGNLRLTPARPPSRLRRIIGYIFPITRIYQGTEPLEQ